MTKTDADLLREIEEQLQEELALATEGADDPLAAKAQFFADRFRLLFMQSADPAATARLCNKVFEMLDVQWRFVDRTTKQEP